MNTQRIPRDLFWSRYGKEKYESTDFQKALSRMPIVTPQGPWIAGGSVRRLATDLPQDSDFDFFFASADQLAAFIARMGELGARKVSENEFNISFVIPAADKLPELKVQAIRITFRGTLEETISAFDFSLCQCGFDGADLVFGQFTLFDLANKRLIPGVITYGVSSLRRIIKYTKQGYRICGGGLATMLEQIANNPEVIQSKVEYID